HRRETPRRRRRNLRPGPQRRPPPQRKKHAPAPPARPCENPQNPARHQTQLQTRYDPDEARRSKKSRRPQSLDSARHRHRARKSSPGPAPDRLPPQLEKIPPGVSPRRPLPPAQQPRRRRPRKTLELLPPAHRDRTSLQGNEKRPRD